MSVNGVEVVEGVEDEIQESERQGKTVVLVSIDGESFLNISAQLMAGILSKLNK